MALNTAGDEIVVPGVAEIPGLRFRHLHAPDDYVGMAAANQRSRDAAGIEEVVTAEGMARDYAYHVNCDPHDDILVVEHGGSIVGYARAEWRDLEDGTRTFTTIMVLDPVLARSGAYIPLLAWAEGRLVAKARAIPADQRRTGVMRTYTFGAEADLAELLAATGWKRTGQGYEMVRETLDDITALAAGCRFSDCGHGGEPGCAVRAAIAAGTLSEDRLASQQKLDRELAHVERKGDPRARAEERKRWKAIHKAVGKHMDQKYGGAEWR